MMNEFWYLESTVHDANVTDWMGDVARESMYVAAYRSCETQVQATNLLRTAISFVINCPYQKQEDDANKRDH